MTNIIKVKTLTIDNIPLLQHARLMARLRQTRCPAKLHVAKKLPKVHGNYQSSIEIYEETDNYQEILANNML